jgi:hypothetical protein
MKPMQAGQRTKVSPSARRWRSGRSCRSPRRWSPPVPGPAAASRRDGAAGGWLAPPRPSPCRPPPAHRAARGRGSSAPSDPPGVAGGPATRPRQVPTGSAPTAPTPAPSAAGAARQAGPWGSPPSPSLLSARFRATTILEREAPASVAGLRLGSVMDSGTTQPLLARSDPITAALMVRCDLQDHGLAQRLAADHGVTQHRRPRPCWSASAPSREVRAYWPPPEAAHGQ